MSKYRLSNKPVSFAQVIRQTLTVKCSICNVSRQMMVKDFVHTSGGDFSQALKEAGWKVRVTHESDFNSAVIALDPLCPMCVVKI